MRPDVTRAGDMTLVTSLLAQLTLLKANNPTIVDNVYDLWLHGPWIDGMM